MSAEDLKWIVPAVGLLSAIIWLFARPACVAFVYFLIDGSAERRDRMVRTPIEAELRQLASLEPRIKTVEDAISAHTDSLDAFEQSLLAQGRALTEQMTQAFERNTDTLEKIERALERIATDTKENSVQIGELRGMWDGATERRKTQRRRSE